MSYRADKQMIDTHTHTDRYTDRGDDNTRRPKLASGKNATALNGTDHIHLADACLASHNAGTVPYDGYNKARLVYRFIQSYPSYDPDAANNYIANGLNETGSGDGFHCTRSWQRT